MNRSLMSKLKVRDYAFAFIVLSLSLTSIVQVECPVCHGSGVLYASPGIENVHILSSDSELLSMIINGCDMYHMYEYRIDLKVENASLMDVSGWLKTSLVDIYHNNNVLDTQYAPLEVPSALNDVTPYQMEISYTIWYQTVLDEELHVDLEVEILNEDRIDDTCNGTGKIGLNLLPLVNALKKGFEDAGRVIVPYKPPDWYIPSYE